MSREDKIKLETDLGELNSEARVALSGNRGARLLLAIEKQPKPPCVDRGDRRPCNYFRQCGSEMLACRSFYAYTREPLDRKEYGKWLQMEKVPSRKFYDKTYRETKKDKSEGKT